MSPSLTRIEQPVHNLKASDFVVLEDNVSQNIKAFEEHASAKIPANEPAKPSSLIASRSFY